MLEKQLQFEQLDFNFFPKDIINEFMRIIQMNKPHFIFIQISFIKVKFRQYDKKYFFEEFGVKVYDNYKRMYKFLKIVKINGSNNKLKLNRDLIEKYSKGFEEFNIPGLEAIKQIQNSQYTLLYDAYLIKLEQFIQSNYVVYELESLDLPYEYFLKKIDQESQTILLEYIKIIEHYKSILYKKSQNIDQPQQYYIKFTDQGIIQVKSAFNINQCVQIENLNNNDDYYYYNDDYDYDYNEDYYYNDEDDYFQKTYLTQNQFKMIFKNNEIKIKQQLKKQLNQLKQIKRIQKSQLSIVLDIMRLQFSEQRYHSKELFQIIQQQHKQNQFSLIKYDKNCIILKVYDTKSNQLLKLQKLNSFNEAYQIKQQYENLKQFQQKNQGIFLNIEECKVIYVESSWYVSFQEHLVVSQKSDKLISFKKLIQNKIILQKMNCPLKYSLPYLKIRYLKYFEKVCKFGFKQSEIFWCQPYFNISHQNKFSLNQVIFSNPYFNEDGLSPYKSYTQDFSITDDDDYDYDYDEDEDTFLFIFNMSLRKYIEFQEKNNFQYTLEEQQDQFPQLNFMIKQIEDIISIKEQFPSLTNDEIFLNRNLKITTVLNTDNLFYQKHLLNQIIQFQFDKFVCSYELLKIYQQYLTKNNQIKYLKIQKTYQNDINQQALIGIFNNEKVMQKNVNSFFQNVYKLSINQKVNYDHLLINKQLFPSLTEIKIRIDESEYELFEKLNNLKKIIQIFNEIKTFKIINIDIYNFLEDSKYIIKYYKQQGEKLKLYDHQKDISRIIKDIDNYFLFQNQNNDPMVKNLKCSIEKILSKYKCLRCEYTFKTIMINDYSLQLTFYDISEFKLGEIEVTCKIMFQGINFVNQLQINSIKIKNHQSELCRFSLDQHSLISLIDSWIDNQLATNLLYIFFGLSAQCKCFIMDQLTSSIYKGQKQIKSIILHINKQYCPAYDINILCNQLCLSQGNQFKDLQEVCLVFYSRVQNYDLLLKDLAKVINKNKRINTIKFIYHDFPIFMHKLKRVVMLISNLYSF